MVSRFLFRLRAVLPALALVFLCSSFNPGAALAKNPYKYTDRTEGDPGDGVLNPVVEPDQTNKKTTLDSSLAGFYLVSLPLPGGNVVVLLPSDWSHLTSLCFQVERGGHNAP